MTIEMATDRIRLSLAFYWALVKPNTIAKEMPRRIRVTVYVRIFLP